MWCPNRHKVFQMFLASAKITNSFCCRSLPNVPTYQKLLGVVSGARNLFSDTSLGMDFFLKKKENFHIKNPEDFKSNLQDIFNSTNKLVFSEDLLNMTYLCKTDEDLEILIKALIRHYSVIDQIKFQKNSLGPTVMRMLYYLNKPDIALRMINTGELALAFKTMSSCFIVMNLFFKNKMYEEVVMVFEKFQNNKFFSTGVILAFAALYKINTSESYEKAYSIWMELKEKYCNKYYKLDRAACFFSVLAFNQGQTLLAMEVFTFQKESPLILNIKLLIFAKEKRLADVNRLLQKILSLSSSLLQPYFIASDVEQFLKKAFTHSIQEERVAFNNFITCFNEENLISNKTLDDCLCEEITYRRKMEFSNMKENFTNQV